jgi:ABC-type uncharacterized transport system substrate-binding protein
MHASTSDGVRITPISNADSHQELMAPTPDALLASGTLSVAAFQNISRTLPIVFVGVSDPVGAGFVDNLARPSGNATGFMLFEYSLSGKWLELLKQIVPSLRQAAVLRDAANPAGVEASGCSTGMIKREQ